MTQHKNAGQGGCCGPKPAARTAPPSDAPESCKDDAPRKPVANSNDNRSADLTPSRKGE